MAQAKIDGTDQAACLKKQKPKQVLSADVTDGTNENWRNAAGKHEPSERILEKDAGKNDHNALDVAREFL